MPDAARKASPRRAGLRLPYSCVNLGLRSYNVPRRLNECAVRTAAMNFRLRLLVFARLTSQ